ncbi:MAG: hypothetical protein FJY82_06245 [Candidatus Aminicenantes bacterium]|nr:hypothetical protein [Candidatus Aminicenantes bacterium]
MDGNLSREGLTADLEAMKRAGIGGVIVMEVNVGVPRGPVEFMSDEWRRLFHHVVDEAERLGLEITLNAGPGWTGSGGPWVRAGQSMRHLARNALKVEGRRRIDVPPFFIHNKTLIFSEKGDDDSGSNTEERAVCPFFDPSGACPGRFRRGLSLRILHPQGPPRDGLSGRGFAPHPIQQRRDVFFLRQERGAG